MTVTSFVRATAAAGIALLVAGCTGSADGSETSAASSTPAAATTSSSTSSAPPTTTTSTSATTQSMAEKYPETPAGAEAFVRAFVGTFNRGSREPSRADELRAFFAPECTSCSGLHSGLVQYRSEGLRQPGEAITILKMRSEFGSEQKVVVAKLRQNPADVVDASGKKKDSVPGDPDLRQAFVLERRDGVWVIVQIQRYADEV